MVNIELTEVRPYYFKRTLTICSMAGLFKEYDDDHIGISELLASLEKPSPDFILWAKTISIDDLSNLIRAVVSIERFSTRQEAVQYLNNISQKISLNGKMAVCDFGGDKHVRPFIILNEYFNGKQGLIKNLYLHHGTISHRIALGLFKKEIPSYPLAHSGYPSKQGHFNFYENDPNRYKQNQLFNPIIISGAKFVEDNILSDNSFSPQLLAGLETLWRQMAGYVDQNDWIKTYYNLRYFLSDFYPMLSVIFGKSFKELMSLSNNKHEEYLTILSLLSWLTLALYKARTEKSAIFGEMQVVSLKDNISGGKADALELLKICGKPITAWQIKILSQLENGGHSIGRWIKKIISKFGSQLGLRVIDWKFAIGDGGMDKILQPSDVVSPIFKHSEQIKRYITLANLDYYRAIESLDRNVWGREAPLKTGLLIYVMPSTVPIVHEIDLSYQDQELYFLENVVYRMHRGKIKSVFRQMNNFLVGTIIKKLNKQNTILPCSKPLNRQLAFYENTNQESIANLVESLRQFKDSLGIIEYTGLHKNGSSKYVMHFDKLTEALKKGKIKASNDFSLEGNRGFISCLMPDHDDSTPSMKISINLGRFKCFGCGVFGHLTGLEDSATVYIQGKIFNGTRQLKKTKDIVISDEHNEIMSFAGETFIKGFHNSEAIEYIISRGIDPELAIKHGAGFADDRAINTLLDEYGYEKLIDYGFISISNRVSTESRLCTILNRRGLKLSQIKKEVSVNGNKTFGLPYFTLSNRILFPLALEKRNTSFYGRALSPNAKIKHYKLSTRNTGVPHGIFNEQVLHSDSNEIVIAEGVMDAFSIMHIFDLENVSAIIGVNNYILAELIARTNKNLAIAFDIDENQTGQKSSGILRERLIKLGGTGKIRDFSMEMQFILPGFGTEFKDYNEWWYSIGKQELARR